MRFVPFAMIIVGGAMAFAGRAAEPASGQGLRHAWWTVAFETPVPFSAPREIGMDAVALTHPPDTAGGVGRIEIVLAAAPKDMVDGMGMSDDELPGYFKTTFLGLSAPAVKKVERTFLGHAVAGGAQSTTIPRARNVESYLVPLAGGAKLFLAVGSDTDVPAADVEAVLAALARTLKEVEDK
ncbi:MAG: hypothetical protein GX414_06150 [Acidobacteria bacterium]|nr:hypothetical protein [Acidobacteriota bacterium]